MPTSARASMPDAIDHATSCTPPDARRTTWRVIGRPAAVGSARVR